MTTYYTVCRQNALLTTNWKTTNWTNTNEYHHDNTNTKPNENQHTILRLDTSRNHRKTPKYLHYIVKYAYFLSIRKWHTPNNHQLITNTKKYANIEKWHHLNTVNTTNCKFKIVNTTLCRKLNINRHYFKKWRLTVTFWMSLICPKTPPYVYSLLWWFGGFGWWLWLVW